MAYCINGTDIRDLCELGYGSSDSRAKADINTKGFLTNGQTRAEYAPNGQFISYASGYTYSSEALGGKFGGWPTFQRYEYKVSSKGCRPSRTHRWMWDPSGSYFIKQSSDGAWYYTSDWNASSGTVILNSSLKARYCFVCMCGAGGGGGGSTAVASAGGGGGAAYRFDLLRLAPFNVIVVGAYGSGGGGKANGNGGTYSGLSCYESGTAYRNGGTCLDKVVAHGGSGGYGGGNNSGGGGQGGGIESPSTGNYIRTVKEKTGAGGGSRNNGGGNSTVNFVNYTPEAETITYFTGLGGSSGGSSGGGGGGGCPLGNGGKGGSGGGGGGGDASGSGGGGGGYKAFTTQSGGNGAKAYVQILY